MSMSVTVHAYGVHYRWCRDIPEPLRRQLLLAHDLREDLVTLQLDQETAIKDVWSSYPAVAAAEAALAEAEATAEAAAGKVRDERIKQRTKRVKGPAADALREARAAVKDCRQRRRDAIAAVREDAKSRLDCLAESLKHAQKALYADYVQGRGLYWATFNDVRQQHQTAVKRMRQARAAGKPASMRHHRFDGSGTIAVQLQREGGEPARAPARIADGAAGKWRNVLHLPGWVDPGEWEQMTRAEQRAAGRVTARLRIGRHPTDDGDLTDTWVDVPIQVHRQLPADADITGARLTFRRIAGSMRASLSVTAKIADPEPVSDGPMVAIHLGWRHHEDGATGHTTAATWRATAPVDVPEHLRPFLHSESGHMHGTIRLPDRVSARVALADEIRSGRDLALEEVKASLADWLTTHGPVPHPTRDNEELTAAVVARWRAPGRFAVLARAWRSAPPPHGEEIAAALEAWRAGDKAAWERQEHGRQRALGHRDDIYRQIAATLARQTGAVVLDDTSVAQIAALPNDLPNDVAQQIGRRRTVAAPGGLRAAIVSACAREGVAVVAVPAAGLSRIHARCGHENPADDRYLSTPVHCDGCGGTYDQDLSAATLMLSRALDQSTQPAGSAREAS